MYLILCLLNLSVHLLKSCCKTEQRKAPGQSPPRSTHSTAKFGLFCLFFPPHSLLLGKSRVTEFLRLRFN